MKSFLLRAVGAAALCSLSCSDGGRTPENEPPPAAPLGAEVISTDERGASRLIVVHGLSNRFKAEKGATAEAAAREHVARFLGVQRSTQAALAVAKLRGVVRLRQGVQVVRLRQERNGVEVYDGDVKVLMKADNELVAISGSLNPAEVSKDDAKHFESGPGHAVAIALSDRFGVPVDRSNVRETGEGSGGFVNLSATAAGLRVEETHAKKVYYPIGESLRPAYVVEFLAGREGDRTEAFRAVVAADTGEVLQRAELTASTSYNYRVFAETTGDLRPLDGPVQNWTPHPAGLPDGTEPAFIAPVMVAVDGMNTNPSGASDPWLPGSSATETRGNNVDAYTDQANAPDGYSNGDIRAITTSTRTFNYTYNTGLSPVANQTQMMAAVTHAFYVTNYLHDYWYDSGFNEAAGNAQLDNYGRGGAGGDELHVEVQDGYLLGESNNAFMAAFSDGISPQMLMYVWDAELRQLTVNPGGTLTVGLPAGWSPQTFSVGPAALILADDGSTANVAPNIGGTVNDACQPLVNNVAGKIVLADRGGCAFEQKAVQVQNAGGLGVIIGNQASSPSPTVPPLMGDDPAVSTTVTIPAYSVNLASSTAMKANLIAGAVTATMVRTTAVQREGALDSLVTAHEWGHYLHRRLASCSAQQCRGMSEGWGDFVAQHMSLRSGDNLDGTYSGSVYAASIIHNAPYFGVRRFPYSVDFTKNALMFRHISNGQALPAVLSSPNGGTNSEVHNAGEIWGTMLFEGYVALQKNPGPRTFEAVRRAMADYVVASLLLTPPDATFTEARDALLGAVQAINPSDVSLVAQAFAVRGAGSCAVSPSRTSTTLTGVVESTAIAPKLLVGSLGLNDSVVSCDQDGLLDDGERGMVSVEVLNSSPVTVTGAQLTATSASTTYSFPSGPTINLPSLPPYSVTTVGVPVELNASVTAPATGDLTATVTYAGGCALSVAVASTFPVHLDEVLASSTTDQVQTTPTPWTTTGSSAAAVWSRIFATPPNRLWSGVGLGSPSDTALQSPAFQVSPSQDFIVAFSHRHKFEAAGANYYDGAVVEVSVAGGAWVDASTYVSPGYGGSIFIGGMTNPLAGRSAYVSQNSTYPAMQTVTLNFGTQLAGQSVRIRFRIGSDVNVGDEGWRIDDIAVSGITNLPFPSVINDATLCPAKPVAMAGSDRTVLSGATVVLDGSGSSDPNGGALAFTWTQTAGPAVTLVSPASAVTAFTAPLVGTQTVLTFELQVSDGSLSDTDSVSVAVQPVGSNSPPTANAGADQTVNVGAAVFLDASGSSDPNSNPLTFAWTQTAGPTVTLATSNTSVTGFTAPAVASNTTLTFSVAVSDGIATTADTVDVVVQAPAANLPPVANAGTDQTVTYGAAVFLDASGSTDPDNNPLTFSWTQTDGPPVTLTGPGNAVSGFTAPNVKGSVQLVFSVTVSDGALDATSTVTVTVGPQSTGCCSTAGGPMAPPWATLIGAVLLMARRRRSAV